MTQAGDERVVVLDGPFADRLGRVSHACRIAGQPGVIVELEGGPRIALLAERVRPIVMEQVRGR